MNVEHTEENVAVKGMPRRVVVKSAAWSLPVFAAVAVTPAFAASGLTNSSLVVDKAGNKFNATWTFAPASVVITNISIQGATPTGSPVRAGNVVTFTAPLGVQGDPNRVPNFTATVTAGTMVSTFSVVGQKLSGNGTPTLNVTQQS